MSCWPIRAAVVIGPLCLMVLPGCGKKEDARKHRRLEGVIEQIDLAASEVTLRYFSDKHQVETTITGRVTAETEIFINGVLSSLGQLRVGERVAVLGWVQGRGDQRVVVADEVRVERAETIRRQPHPADAQADDASPPSSAVPPTPAGPDGGPGDRPDPG